MFTKKFKKINLKSFRMKYPEYDNISDHWFCWFIGFFEGDGCFMIGKSNIEIIITQNELDKFVLFEIKDSFSFGRVLVQKKFNVPGRLWTYRYICRDFASQKVLLDLFHNNLILPKSRVKYNGFVEKYNEKLERAKERRKTKFKQVEKAIFCDDNDRIYPSEDDSWLCGFTDAEGCFYTGFTKEGKIRGCFEITQKEHKIHSCTSVFEHIKQNIFLCGHLNIKSTTTNPKQSNSVSIYLELRSSSLQRDLTKIHKYFDLFTLKTKKLYDFLLQKEIVYRVSQPNWEKNREQIIVLIKRNRGLK